MMKIQNWNQVHGKHKSFLKMISVKFTWPQSKLERCQHDLGLPEGGVVIDSVARGSWRRKLTTMSCRFAHAPTRPESTGMLSYLGRNLRRQGSPRRATLSDAGRAEESRYCGKNGLTCAGDRCPNCRRAVWSRERERERERETWLPKSGNTPTILTSNGPYSVRPEQPTSVTYRSSSPGRVFGAKHPHHISWHWAPSPGEISLSSPPGCSSVVSLLTASSIAQPWSRSEGDITQRRPPSHPLDAAYRPQAKTTPSCICNVIVNICNMYIYRVSHFKTTR